MKYVLAALVLMSSLATYAQTRVVSIDAFDLSYTGGLMLRNQNTKRGSDREETIFKFNLNYAQNLGQYEGLMWKAKAYWNRESVDWGSNESLSSELGAAGGILYNFQANDIKNSFMAGAMIGLERGSYEYNDNDDESGFNWTFELEAGKRWDMGQYSVANISYAPTVSFGYKRYGGDIRDEYFKSATEVKFNFLKFDILF